MGLGDELHVEFAGDADAQSALLGALVGHGLRVLTFSERGTDLEDIFMKVTKGLVQ